MNKVMLIGNVVRDLEMSKTSSGHTVCSFSIAVSRKFVNADGEKETDFFNIVTWRGLAENCAKYLKKGSKISVVGSIQNRSYLASDGTKRHTTDIMAEDVEFLTPKKNDNEEDYGTSLQPVDDNGLPF